MKNASHNEHLLDLLYILMFKAWYYMPDRFISKRFYDNFMTISGPMGLVQYLKESNLYNRYPINTFCNLYAGQEILNLPTWK